MLLYWCALWIFIKNLDNQNYSQLLKKILRIMSEVFFGGCWIRMLCFDIRYREKDNKKTKKMLQNLTKSQALNEFCLFDTFSFIFSVEDVSRKQCKFCFISQVPKLSIEFPVKTNPFYFVLNSLPRDLESP